MTAPRKRQGGYAIAAISLLGLAAMSAAAMMISDGGSGDSAQLEEELVKLRAEWAAVGHMTYVISRARQDGLCDSNCSSNDGTRAVRLQVLAEEIYNANTSGIKAGAGGKNRFKLEYAEFGTKYSFDTALFASDINSATDGMLDLTITFPDSSGNVDLVRDSLRRMTSFGATLCVGLAAAGDPCPATLASNETGGIARLAEFRVIR